MKEFQHGSNLLPPVCKYLFQTTQEKLLGSTINNKKLWLANAWASRDTGDSRV